MRVADYIVLTVLAILFVLAVRYCVKHRNSCCGDCSKCASCRACTRKEKK